MKNDANLESIRKESIPWYSPTEFEKYDILVRKYVCALEKLPFESLQFKELFLYDRKSRVRHIFESNRLDRIASFKKQKKEQTKLIEDFFPKLTDSILSEEIAIEQEVRMRLRDSFVHDAILERLRSKFEKYTATYIDNSFSYHMHKRIDFIGVLKGMLIAQDRKIELRPTLSYSDGQRDLREFIRHSEAQEVIIVFSFLLGFLGTSLISFKIEKPEFQIPSIDYITQKFIKQLHERLTDGLLSENDLVKSGQYRIDVRNIDGATNLQIPAPEYIEPMMEDFCRRASAQLLNPGYSPWIVAASVSYEFVAIHPFPNFNGRLSRLLLDMVLRIYGIPFSIVIQGHKKGRERYRRALRDANRGNLNSYACLILRTLVESFQEIDQNLTRAGVPTLLSLLPPDPDPPKNTPQPPA